MGHRQWVGQAALQEELLSSKTSWVEMLGGNPAPQPHKSSQEPWGIFKAFLWDEGSCLDMSQTCPGMSWPHVPKSQRGFTIDKQSPGLTKNSSSGLEEQSWGWKSPGIVWRDGNPDVLWDRGHFGALWGWFGGIWSSLGLVWGSLGLI